jgi:hypothetical protein
LRYFSTTVAISVFSVIALVAQSTSVSQISGTVQDSTGSAIAGAQVRVTQTDTGLVRTTTSDSAGTYVLTNLPVGPYRMEVSKDGFSTYVQTGIVLQVNTNPTIEVSLKVGSITEQVQVEAAATMVETRTTGVGQVVDSQRIVDIPLNGRNATDLIYLAGAAAQAPPADLISTKNYPGEAALSIAGGMANGTLYMLDGASHNDPFNNLNLPLPFPDALQEFKVETNALPAQYGQHSAGAVNAVTKSGTNEFHGDAFEFIRNYHFNARNFYAASRDSLKRNQFGGTFGGPIKKDKLFVFLGYQGNIIRSNPAQASSFIPTAQMMSGDFTTIASPLCNGNRQITLKAPFVNNQISPSLFSPAAVKMMTFYPATSDPCGKEFFGTVQNTDEHMGVARADYQLSASQSMFVRYYVTHALVSPTYDGKNPLTMTFSGADDLVNSGVFGHTWVLGTGTVNSFRATFNRSAVTKTEVPTFDGPSLGIKMHTLVPGHLVATATGAIYSSVVFSYAARDPTTSHQLADDVSVVKGNHQFGFGANWIRPVQYVYGPLNGDGNFTFDGSVTGLSMADFLIGNARTFTQGGIQYDYERYNYIGLYGQDTWKVTPHLTVNAGLRWEPYIGGQMNLGYVAHFDPALFTNGVHSTVYSNAPAGVLFPGDTGFDTNNKPSHVKWNVFAPRLGMVWDPKGNGRMTVRASWGIFSEMPHTLFAYGFSQAPPWGSTITLNNVSFDSPWATASGGDPFPLQLGKNAIFPIPANYTTYPLNLRTTYLEQWNLSVERQISANWLLKVAYLGTHTVHLWSDRAINAAQIVPSTSPLGTCPAGVTAGCDATSNTNQRRALYLQNQAQGQYYGTVHSLDDGGTASYQGLLLTAQHRLAAHYTVLANYTFSHCITDPFTSELDGVQYTNPANRRFDRGNCVTIDRKHLVNVSGVFESPKFAGRWTQALLGNWSASTSLRITSGPALTVTTALDQALNGIGGQRPNLNGNPYASNPSPGVWLNPAAFSQPVFGTFGNAAVGGIRGPAWVTLDAALFRTFSLGEKRRLELRGEAFNLPNHVRPPNPGLVSSTASTFGQTTTAVVNASTNSTGDPRIMQFALKYIF